MKPLLHKLLTDWIGIDTEVKVSSVAGGDIHNSYSVKYIDEEKVQRVVFVKMNSLEHQAVLRSEHQSLLQIGENSALHYPQPLYFQTDSEFAYLIMTHHRIQPLNMQNSALAGLALARQHKVVSNKFGWSGDNHIGTAVQRNVSSNDWAGFFRDCRLIPQLEIAVGNGLANVTVGSLEFICEQLPNLLAERAIRPCLLHGDLWNGNIGFDSELGMPIFYDPAPYFGDAEVDLAMTRLFGGFEPSFYRAYYSEYAGRAQPEQVHAVYNLYHALNHFNLFGHNYQTLVDRLIYQTGLVA